jgi:hypothetical protein
MTTQKWTDERTAQLQALVGNARPVQPDTVEAAAQELDTTARSVAAKLRKLGYEVASMAKTHQSAFSDDESQALRDFMNTYPNRFTYTEIAQNFVDGKFNAKQVQGKILSLEMTKLVKPTEKAEAVRTYTEAEEVKFVELVTSGAFVEDIAEALGKSANSVRCKALSLLRSGQIEKIPAQRESHAKTQEDALEALGDISELTVEEIAKAINKTERGVKTSLTRRGLVCKNYDGAQKKAKAAEKAAA